jgi:hypothetical protein
LKTAGAPTEEEDDLFPYDKPTEELKTAGAPTEEEDDLFPYDKPTEELKTAGAPTEEEDDLFPYDKPAPRRVAKPVAPQQQAKVPMPTPQQEDPFPYDQPAAPTALGGVEDLVKRRQTQQALQPQPDPTMRQAEHVEFPPWRETEVVTGHAKRKDVDGQGYFHLGAIGGGKVTSISGEADTAAEDPIGEEDPTGEKGTKKKHGRKRKSKSEE